MFYEKNSRTDCVYGIFVVALWKFDVVIEVLKSIWKIVFPFALGGAIAFVINVPMSFLEKNARKDKRK